jgi:hypothetical protein
MDFSSDS